MNLATLMHTRASPRTDDPRIRAIHEISGGDPILMPTYDLLQSTTSVPSNQITRHQDPIRTTGRRIKALRRSIIHRRRRTPPALQRPPHPRRPRRRMNPTGPV